MLQKPIYVGFTVLDVSKWLTHNFHYNFIKKNVDAELLFTDTDSLTYEIKSENVYENFFKCKNLFDFNNFSKDSKFFNETNKIKPILRNFKISQSIFSCTCGMLYLSRLQVNGKCLLGINPFPCALHCYF